MYRVVVYLDSYKNSEIRYITFNTVILCVCLWVWPPPRKKLSSGKKGGYGNVPWRKPKKKMNDNIYYLFLIPFGLNFKYILTKR